jgi:xylan 1,4-beta-xylosidase
MRRSHILALAVVFTLCSDCLSQAQPSSPRQGNILVVDAKAPSHPFPHFWEQMFGSGRAILSLRDSYRSDLRAVKQITDFTYVRFHAIFDDEVGIYSEDSEGIRSITFRTLIKSTTGCWRRSASLR